MLRLSSHSFFKNLKRYQTDANVDLQRQSAILPSSKPYQLRTIKWMVHKEKHNQSESIIYIYWSDIAL